MANPNKSSKGRRTGSNNRVANLSVPTSSAGSRAGAAAGTRRAKPKPAAKPDAKGDWRSKVGNTDVATLRKGQDDAVRNHPANKPAAKAPAPKPQPTAKPAAVTSGGSTPASRPTSSAAKTNSNVGPVASGDDYARNKDPKKYNPLMQKTFGYQ